MGTTLIDIAEKAGVSQATVSRVINAKPGASEQSRKKVLAAIEELGLPLDRLQRNGTKLVAIVTPDLSNPIFAEYVTALVTLFARRGLLAIVCAYSLAGTSEEGFVRMLATQSPVGAVFLSGTYDLQDGSDDVYRPLVERHVPLVFVNGSEARESALVVGTDDAAAMTMAVRHLADLGHERIGLLMGDRDHLPSIVKERAAREFLAARGIDVPSGLTAWTTYGVESGRQAARRILENGATAIACASDELALGAVRAALAMGLDVPGDVSVTGYDDSPLMGAVTPALTTVRQPVRAISRAVVNSLAARIAGRGDADDDGLLLLEPELVVRETTAPCRHA
ncbi:LacI family DNA-binding transcriptional regulator [Bifidobacterium choloepi]|uniref:LacI family transcriptional regulator n=1 Tax=Bifidobacterium choloepi TaxID=2614131 RepID=A0A6I5N028_9BIFI|nr:LacI family DNA-binding transcriptional regulator [Bifidobacterium choloepi]NEG70288.1 LacI family transcriptional regulator [Bifidobacterium choloepi]